MNSFTLIEYTDMVLVYGKVDGNVNAAVRLYAERYPNRTQPSNGTFRRLIQRFRDTGSVALAKRELGAIRSRRTVDMEEEVLDRISINPETSTQIIATSMNVSKTSVWQVINEEGLYPYHLQKVQELFPVDFARRVAFCTWFLQRCEQDPQFQRRILFTDEALFTKEGIRNSRNEHIWNEENPHGIRCRSFQNRFSINVWAGIIDKYLIGPYVLPQRLTGPLYLTFLQEVLPQLLEDIPLNIRQDMWLQQDGAPPHFARNVRMYLDDAFEGRWIGRGGPVAWPPRSPDLTPLDFFLWGHLKGLIYKTPVENEEDLRRRIFNAAEEIRRTPDIFDKTHQNMVQRCNACDEAGGEQFEQFLGE